MKVSEIMIDKPPVVTRDDTISQAARAIDELHSSLVPVVDSHTSKHVVGVITDKDVMRCTASGDNPATLRAKPTRRRSLRHSTRLRGWPA